MRKEPKAIKETNFLKGRDALRDLYTRCGVMPGIPAENHTNPLLNPRSKHFNKTVAARRAKEKARRHFNQLQRA